MPSFADYIQAAALTALAGTGTFVQETREQATLTANNGTLPLVVLGDFTTNQKATTDRVARADMSLFFGDVKPGQGDDPVAENAAVARMDALKRRFLAALDANPTLEIVNIRATPYHNTYEAELTGVAVQFTMGIPAPALLNYCLPDLPSQSAEEPAPPLLAGFSNNALLLALIQNGTIRPGHETSVAYGADYH